MCSVQSFNKNKWLPNLYENVCYVKQIPSNENVYNYKKPKIIRKKSQ